MLARRSRGSNAAVAAVLLLSACHSDLPPGIEPVRIEIADEFPMGDWIDRGFEPLTPPVHLPSSDRETRQVEIWARLPAGTVTVERGPEGPTLRFGPGTAVDRIEWNGRAGERRIADVRGTQIDADGTQTFRTLRPDGDALVGFAWPAGSSHLHEIATERMVTTLADTAPLRRSSPTDARRELRAFRAKNACADCHTPLQPVASTSDERLVRRGTDASGFYVPATVLTESAVLEVYGRFERNGFAPFVTLSCPGGEAPMLDGTRPLARCPNRAVPMAHFDLEAALAAGDAHARDVCRSRSILRAAMDETARKTFASSFERCETANGTTHATRSGPTRAHPWKVQ
jgi:hypothetical protein